MTTLQREIDAYARAVNYKKMERHAQQIGQLVS